MQFVNVSFLCVPVHEDTTKITLLHELVTTIHSPDSRRKLASRVDPTSPLKFPD